ncbi:MAG TPA: nucleotidyltransferase family protein [Reyranella sp.]|nr:nucleotidyltransferase family protein [Reyranella sp.]
MTPPASNTSSNRIEFELLSAAVRPAPDLARVRDCLAGGAVDFEELEALADDHGVRPLLALALAAVQWRGVPDPLRQALEAFGRQHLVRSLAMSEALGRLVQLYNHTGMRFAVFKGPVVAVGLYGELSRREFTDLDVIVPPDQRAKAEDLARRLGFASRQGDRVFREAFLAYQRQYALVGNNTAVDLHWGFTARPLPFPLKVEEIWLKRIPVRVGTVDVPALAPEETALLLAGHGMKEAWKSLAWICDFAMVIDREPGLDWRTIHDRARRQGSGDSVLVGALLAERICGVPVPASLAPVVARRARAERIAVRIETRLRGGHAALLPRRDLEDLDLCDGAWRRFWALMSFALTPTPGDYQAMKLPRPLWRLYYLTRPFRLAWRVLRRR